jgi:hypothetical protein
MPRAQVFSLFLLLVLILVPQLGAQSADTPLPLQLRIPAKATLDQNDSAYFKVALPAEEIRVVLDVARADQHAGNIQGGLALLDSDGGVIQNGAIGFNEVDVRWRKVTYFTLKKPVTMGFKVTNANAKAHFWLTVSKKSDLPLVPFFGEVIPTPIVLGEGKTGRLMEGEDALFVTPLPKGEYKAIAEFTNTQKERWNIQGYLAFLDQDGGNQEALIGFNEVDVSFRKTAGFTVKKDAVFIFRIHDSGEKTMNFLLRVSPALPE